MLTRQEKFENVRKIAVLRANAVGDFICTLPALEALRAAYPKAEIVLLGKRWHADFLKDRPGPVDRVVVVPPYPGVSEPPDSELHKDEVDRFFGLMQRERFDLAIQVHGGGGNSNPFLLRLQARHTVGLKTPEAVPLERWLHYQLWQPEILRHLEVASLVGASAINLEPQIELTSKDLAEAKRIVDPWPSKGLIVMHPGATDPKRRWPTEKFAAVGTLLAEQGWQLAVTGTTREKEVIDNVIQQLRVPALNLQDRLSLGGLAALLSQSRLLISNDTGPLHLAIAVGTPTVGIYWAWNLMDYGPLTRSHHRPLVSWNFTCPACGQNQSQHFCEHSDSLVAGLSEANVLASAMELLR